jgi:gamma-glutamyl hercynylcysteine S-oxide synthase
VRDDLRQALGEVRERTFALVAHLEDDQLAASYSTVMSPLAWDLGHVAAYEDMWIGHRVAGTPLLRPGLAELYDAFETPRAVRADLDFLRGDALRGYMAEVRERALQAPDGHEPLVELVLRHELQHTETMLQAMALADLLPPRFPGPRAVGGGDLEPMKVPAGPAAIGSPPDGFAYDNERPRHRVDVPAFRIGRRPVTNASWLRFAEGGGYVRREWWSREGWAWKEDHDITHHPGAAEGDPAAPVVHVSWFEADAFARAHGARLPTEFQWEKAATWGQAGGTGEVWEWTSSPFRGYPGFVADPYPEYSEVFFGDRYRVLRGCSCATHPRVASPRFRNWDLPERRQLFAGVRIAR